MPERQLLLCSDRLRLRECGSVLILLKGILSQGKIFFLKEKLRQRASGSTLFNHLLTSRCATYRLTLSVTDHKKPRLLPGSYHGSQAKPSPWQSVPLSNRAAFSSNPRRTPQSTHLNPGQLPGLPRPWPGNDSPLASRPLLNAPLSLAPLNLADFSRIKTGQAATFSSQASPEVMSTFSNPSHLTSERAIRGDRHQFDATDLSDGTANHVANLAEESADIERRALSGQAAFSGRTSESASPNTPCRAPLERVDWSDLQPECSQPSTAGGGSVKAERSPERAQMDPPLLYRASSARPRQGDYQQGQMGARDTHVRGMHLQTKPAEEWSFDGDEFKSVQWGR